MKLRNTAIVWNDGKGDLLAVEYPRCIGTKAYEERQFSIGAVFTDWTEDKGYPRIYRFFIEMFHLMVRDKSIKVEDIIKEMTKIDEFKCIFHNDIYETIGLRIPTDEDEDIWWMYFKKEYNSYDKLK